MNITKINIANKIFSLYTYENTTDYLDAITESKILEESDNKILIDLGENQISNEEAKKFVESLRKTKAKIYSLTIYEPCFDIIELLVESVHQNKNIFNINLDDYYIIISDEYFFYGEQTSKIDISYHKLQAMTCANVLLLLLTEPDKFVYSFDILESIKFYNLIKLAIEILKSDIYETNEVDYKNYISKLNLIEDCVKNFETEGFSKSISSLKLIINDFMHEEEVIKKIENIESLKYKVIQKHEKGDFKCFTKFSNNLKSLILKFLDLKDVNEVIKIFFTTDEISNAIENKKLFAELPFFNEEESCETSNTTKNDQKLIAVDSGFFDIDG